MDVYIHTVYMYIPHSYPEATFPKRIYLSYLCNIIQGSSVDVVLFRLLWCRTVDCGGAYAMTNFHFFL